MATAPEAPSAAATATGTAEVVVTSSMVEIPPRPGDRVYVTDPGLAKLREVMRSFGAEPTPNHHGTIDRIEGDTVYVRFDSEDGPGQGQLAPYPLAQVRRLEAS